MLCGTSWKSHGSPINVPRKSYESPMDALQSHGSPTKFPWKSHRGPWKSHASSMEVPWESHGSPIELSWDRYSPIEFPWQSHENDMEDHGGPMGTLSSSPNSHRNPIEVNSPTEVSWKPSEVRQNSHGSTTEAPQKSHRN